MTILTRPFQRAINQYCSIHSSFAINEKNGFWQIHMEMTLGDNFWPTGSVFKKYYGKPIEDRDPIFVALFFYCNISNEKNNSEHENIRKYGLAPRVNFTPLGT